MTRHALLILICTGLASASSFKTDQGRYSVTEAEPAGVVTQGRWAWGSPFIMTETRRIAGLTLCQNALAEHILVIGNGPGLCKTLLLSNTVKTVTWAHPDAEFVETYMAEASPTGLISESRLILHKGSVTSLLETRKQAYDIIIVNVPTLHVPACRDIMSPEFHALIQEALTPLGLAAFSGPDIPGDTAPPHATFLAAVQYRRLNQRFIQTLTLPGQPMFFLCSKIQYMTTYAPRLEARFSLLDQAQIIWPRDRLEEIYTPSGPTQLRNLLETVDPNTPYSRGLYHLLHRADQLNVDLLPHLNSLRNTGPWRLGILILCMAVTRLLYVLAHRARPKGQALAGDPVSNKRPAAFLAGCAGILLAWGVTQFLLIPLFETRAMLWILGAALLACLILFLSHRLHAARPGPLLANHALFTPLGYGLFGVCLSIVMAHHVTSFVNRPDRGPSVMPAVPQWTEGLEVRQKTLTTSDDSPAVPYKEVHQDQRLKGYIFQTRDFTKTVYGYGGPIGLILFVQPDGTLMDFRFTQSYETPRYIRYIRGWLMSLRGRSLFDPSALEDVHAVSGATLTTVAIKKLMRRSGQTFATRVLSLDSVASHDNGVGSLFLQKGLICLIIGVGLTLAASLHGRLWSRICVLVYTAGVFGLWLNKQYSTEHILRVLTWDHALAGTPESLALLLGVPVLVVLLGNLYCGYLCPFGAIQELISLVIPKRFKPKLSHGTVRGARFIKYGILFALVIGTFLLDKRDWLQIAPLTTVFNRQLWPKLFLVPLWVCLLIGMVFVTRCWCRYLCPTGAFLSMLNRCAWLQRLLPAKKYGRCEFGLTGRDKLDCIYCDRCNYDESTVIPQRKEAITKDAPGLMSRIFLIWLLVTASLLIWPLLHKKADSPAPTEAVPSVSNRR